MGFFFLRITNLLCDVISVVQQQLDNFTEKLKRAGWVNLQLVAFSIKHNYNLTYIHTVGVTYQKPIKFKLNTAHPTSRKHIVCSLHHVDLGPDRGNTVPYYKLVNNWRFNFFINVKNGLPVLRKLVLLWILQQNGKSVCLLPDIMQLLRLLCAVTCNSTLWLCCRLHRN